jgi:hypothetical protein
MAKARAPAKRNAKPKTKPRSTPPRARTSEARIALPTLAELTSWYRTLAVSTPEGERGGNMLFYEACWSDDVDLERAFEGWAATIDNPHGLPLDLLEESLADARRFTQLYAFLRTLDATRLARAVPMMRAFVANPGKRARFESTKE